VIDGVPLSPSRASFIKDSLHKAKLHHQVATEAANAGDNHLANIHVDEFNKQTIKVDSAIKAKESLLSARAAQSNGDINKAHVFLNEVNKNNMKIAALSNAEKLNNEAQVLYNQGKHDDASVVLNEAAKEETKASAIIKADEHIEKLKIALANNNKEHQEYHILKIHELQDLLNKLCNNEFSYELPENTVHEAGSPRVTNSSNTIAQPEYNSPETNFNGEDMVNGFDEGSYASYN
jgi:hypothetical protein